MNVRLCGCFALVVSGCCFAPAPSPAVPDLPVPVVPAPPIAPIAPIPGPPMPSVGIGSTSIGDPFDVVLLSTPQLPGLRALFDAAPAAPGDVRDGVLVCSATLLGGGYDDSLFAGGADVALAMRIGEGALRSTPQSSERVYSFPTASLTHGQTVWVRVVDRDILFDDTIAEGTTTFEGAPFRLTMGQANVECRALAPTLVAEQREAARTRLARILDRLPVPAPDLAAADLGAPSAATNDAAGAARELAAWSDPSDPALERSLAPGHAWYRAWHDAITDAVDERAGSLPAPGTPVADGHAQLTVTDLACGASATALRAEIGEAATSTAAIEGCIVRLQLRGHAPPLRLDATSDTGDTWTLGRGGELARASVLAVRVDGRWQSVERGAVSAGSDAEVAFVLSGDAEAPLLRLGRPFAHAQLLRLR